MNLIGRFLRPPYLIGAGILTFSATTLLLTRVLGLSLLLAILLLVTLGLVLAIVFLVRRLQQLKASEEIEKTISRQADRDIERSVPGKAAEMEDMKAQLVAAIEALKASKIGRRLGPGALSQLPWYMVIGPAGAGKSALIAGSGLHFPLLDEKRHPKSVRGVGGTRRFEWWLSEEAVLLDMAGKALATAQFEESDDWVDFLETLRSQRRGRPLNGVLVAVSVDALAERGEAQAASLAQGVRERLEELVHHLGVVFPVYVVFTQCDRLAGFAEFFDELSPGERHQPWGATLALEEARDGEAAKHFDRELDTLLAQLSDRRLSRMSALKEPGARALAFALPLQIESLRASARRFVRTLFDRPEGEEGPLFRGFYFTSAEASGVPVDRVLQPVAASVGAAAAVTPQARAAEGSFFVHDLLAKVVFADAAVATSSSRAERMRRRGRLFMFAGLGVGFLAVTVMLSTLSCANGRLIARTRAAARAAADRVRPDLPLMENVLVLEDLRENLVVVDSLSRRKPLWRRVGAYAGDVMLEPGVRLYVEKSLETVVTPAVRDMESRLLELTDTGEGSFLRYYYLFRAWRLLNEPKQLDPFDAPLLGREMAQILASRVAAASPAERERFPVLVARQVAFLAAHSDWMASYAPSFYRVGNPDLIARGMRRLRDTWDSSQFYEQLVRDASAATQPATLTSLVGGVGMLNGTYAVPGPFTRAGWEKAVRPRVERYRTQMQRDWVVADAFRPGAPPDLGHDLLALYARDYVAEWVKFLQGLGVAEPPNLAGAAEMLKSAAGDDSPVLKTLRAVGDQTRLGVDAGSELGQVQSQFEMAHDFFESPGAGGGVKRAAGFITQFFQKPKANVVDRSQSPSAQYQTQLRAAAETVLQAAQPGAPASEIKKLMAVGDESNNPLKQLVAWSQGLAAAYSGSQAAEPIARLLQAPILGARAAARGGIQPELNERWRLLVVQPFERTLMGKYPFAESGEEATLFDFTEFFKPGGTFWTFYDDHLKDFAMEDGTPRLAEGETSPLSPALLACLRQAFEIREAFFAGGGGAPSLRFSVRTSQPRIEGPRVPVRWVSFDVGGRFATYSMGAPQWAELEWPGADPNAGAALRAQAGDAAAESRNAPGIWGLFRLLDQAHGGSQPSGTATATWRLAAGESRLTVSYELQTSASRHPFRPGFLRFSLPSGL